MTNARVGVRLLSLAVLAWSLLLATNPASAQDNQPRPSSMAGDAAPGQPAAGESDSGPEADFITVGQLDELTEDHATMFRLYRAFFLRDPDARGALYWIERQERCDALSGIADQFAAGEEFANRYGRLDDVAFVEQIYRNVLGRQGDVAGLHYWTDLVVGGELSRGEMVLNVSLSAEFQSRHRYPSDGVPSRPCRLPEGEPTPRSHHFAGGERFASVIDAGSSESTLDLASPAPVVELVGFHQSTHPGAQPMVGNETGPVPTTALSSRRRGTDPRGAADIVVHPLVPITSPVAGRVARAGNYVLYCRYRDGYVVINPTDRPELEVKILHIQDVEVRAGDWVDVGDHLAARATLFPFQSQIDRLTAEPSWPHVHIEVVDPRIPKKSAGSSC